MNGSRGGPRQTAAQRPERRKFFSLAFLTAILPVWPPPSQKLTRLLVAISLHSPYIESEQVGLFCPLCNSVHGDDVVVRSPVVLGLLPRLLHLFLIDDIVVDEIGFRVCWPVGGLLRLAHPSLILACPRSAPLVHLLGAICFLIHF